MAYEEIKMKKNLKAAEAITATSADGAMICFPTDEDSIVMRGKRIGVGTRGLLGLGTVATKNLAQTLDNDQNLVPSCFAVSDALDSMQSDIDGLQREQQFTGTQVVKENGSTPAPGSNFVVRVLRLLDNEYVYVCFEYEDGSGTIIKGLGNTYATTTATPFGNYTTLDVIDSNTNTMVQMQVSMRARDIGAGSILKMRVTAVSGDKKVYLRGMAFCPRAYATWNSIPDKYKATFYN